LYKKAQTRRGVHRTPASNGRNIVIEINYMNETELSKWCSDEHGSPLQNNARLLLCQNI